MGELPRSEMPRAQDGYDVARVDEAFASFAERVHELESVAGELRAELRALRSERLDSERLGPERPFESERWPAEGGSPQPGVAASPDWIASVPAPLIRPVAVPRLAFEAVFLALVALFAGLADLSTTSIAIVMAAAWGLVVLSEWAAAAKRSRWRLDSVAPAADLHGEAASDSTGPWSMPVVQATVVEAPEDSESHTVVARLPAQPESPEPQTAQPEAAQPEAEELEVAEPAVGEAAVATREAAKPDAAAPELPDPELTNPETPEPEAVEPEAVEPEAVEPEAKEPEIMEPGGPDPETPDPESQESEPAEASATEPAEAEPPPPPVLVAVPPVEPDPQPKRRGFFRRRRSAEEPDSDAPDPWEI